MASLLGGYLEPSGFLVGDLVAETAFLLEATRLVGDFRGDLVEAAVSDSVQAGEFRGGALAEAEASDSAGGDLEATVAGGVIGAAGFVVGDSVADTAF